MEAHGGAAICSQGCDSHRSSGRSVPRVDGPASVVSSPFVGFFLLIWGAPFRRPYLREPSSSTHLWIRWKEIICNTITGGSEFKIHTHVHDSSVFCPLPLLQRENKMMYMGGLIQTLFTTCLLIFVHFLQIKACFIP